MEILRVGRGHIERYPGDTRNCDGIGHCHRLPFFAATCVLLALMLTVAARDELAAQPSQRGGIWQSYAKGNITGDGRLNHWSDVCRIDRLIWHCNPVLLPRLGTH